MAFDGITIANVVQEMKDVLIGGRIYKIAQPEPDEMILPSSSRTDNTVF